ncbi:MAG TPA: hypothetical protein VHH88_13985 [Verrucomicrobiae bacterium]|nr:hypothetical protein [Verrucomicrobiae bacterium]
MTQFTAKQFLAFARRFAGLMAVLVFALQLLAVDGEFHRSLHHEGKAKTTSCVLCLFVHGQVHLADAAPIAPAPVHSPFALTLRTESVAMPDTSYLAFPSRAPPVSLLLSSVVG